MCISIVFCDTELWSSWRIAAFSRLKTFFHSFLTLLQSITSRFAFEVSLLPNLLQFPTTTFYFWPQDAICTSLSEYNAHIEELKQEMQGATDSAKHIRADIQEIRNKWMNNCATYLAHLMQVYCLYIHVKLVVTCVTPVFSLLSTVWSSIKCCLT